MKKTKLLQKKSIENMITTTCLKLHGRKHRAYSNFAARFEILSLIFLITPQVRSVGKRISSNVVINKKRIIISIAGCFLTSTLIYLLISFLLTNLKFSYLKIT